MAHQARGVDVALVAAFVDAAQRAERLAQAGARHGLALDHTRGSVGAPVLVGAKPLRRFPFQRQRSQCHVVGRGRLQRLLLSMQCVIQGVDVVACQRVDGVEVEGVGG